MKTALTIAGSDSSGGAGIQADIKTMTANGVYAMSAIASLTAQNTTGVFGIENVSKEFLALQLDCVFKDIFPDAVKIGMLSAESLIKVTAEKLLQYGAKNVVVDPVMISTSGCRLIDENAVDSLQNCLFPLATVITPNIPEAELLSGMKIENKKDMVNASKTIFEKFGCAVLCKGGHSVDSADDLLYTKDGEKWFCTEKVENKNTHGTGCTLSSAIASNLAKGFSLEKSIELAKNYITLALKDMLDLGHGHGPLNHLFAIKSEFFKEEETDGQNKRY